MCQEQPGLSCHTADNPVFAQAGALAATAALALPVPAPRSRAAPSFPGDTRPCAWSGYLWHLPGQGQDRGTVSLVPSVPGSGWIPVEWATSPAPRAALPPGTKCHSRAGGAVPGRSALRCAGGWGRTSLSLSSLSPTGSPSRPPAARAWHWCRADRGSPQLRVLGVPLTPCPAPRCPRSCPGLALAGLGTPVRCGCQAVLRFRAGEQSLFYRGAEPKSTGDAKEPGALHARRRACAGTRAGTGQG